MFLGISYLEWSANLMTAVCILLAGRNNVHTWWTGIVACILFGALFYQANLYADVTLQAFFIVTGFIGWWNWITVRAQSFDRKDVLFKVKEADPITKVSAATLQKYFGVAVLVAIGYGFLLHKFTNAYAPWIDSMVLTLSVVAQLLLMRRQLQTWPVWVAVNILSVPLYFSRELYLSAALYSVFLVNAIVSWRHWLNLFDEQERTLKA
jgi:nicotinamide mononucleotide transporter